MTSPHDTDSPGNDDTPGGDETAGGAEGRSAVTTAGSAIVTIPNIVSFVRLLLVPVFVWLIVIDRIAAAGWLLGIIGATDWIDGYLARRLGQVSEIGKVLDPVADRLAVATAVVGGLIVGVLPAWFAWALITREVVVAAGAAILAARIGGKLEVRFIGKLATLLLYFAISFWYVGVGTPFVPLEVVAWLVGVPGLVLYWVAAGQYFGDMRDLMAGKRSGRGTVG